MRGQDLHKNVSTEIHALPSEQVCTILKRSNYQFSLPGFLGLTEYKTIYTPIEEKLLAVLEEYRITYEPQVHIGRYKEELQKKPAACARRLKKEQATLA